MSASPSGPVVLRIVLSLAVADVVDGRAHARDNRDDERARLQELVELAYREANPERPYGYARSDAGSRIRNALG